jgi:hypothetical protein
LIDLLRTEKLSFCHTMNDPYDNHYRQQFACCFPYCLLSCLRD